MSNTQMVREQQPASRPAETTSGSSSSGRRAPAVSLRTMGFAEGERALAPALDGALQLYGGGSGAADVRGTAAAGVADGGHALPHREAIQRSFGAHDVSAVSAHVGGRAAEASAAIGASAYATGNDVAFASSPSLHTAAHEAAHVVQQRAGVQLEGGVGKSGDHYERQADAVADAVVAGRSAEGLLDATGGSSTKRAAPGTATQREEAKDGAAAPAQDGEEAKLVAAAEAAAGTLAGGQGSAWHWNPPWDQGGIDPNMAAPREVIFNDGAIQKLLLHLTQKWGCSNQMTVEPLYTWPPVPGWVEVLRTHAHYVRKGAPADQVRLAEVVKQMCESVKPMTDGEKFRERTMQKAEEHIGAGATAVVPQATLDTYSTDFTSCTSFVPTMASDAKGAGDPSVSEYFGGPNKYMECNPSGKKSLGGAWHGVFRGNMVKKGDLPVVSSDRPKAGDMVIFKNIGQFEVQHISFFSSLTPSADGTKEQWVSVGGGKEPLINGKRIEAPAAAENGEFDPKTGFINGSTKAVLGWIDTASLYDLAKRDDDEKQKAHAEALAKRQQKQKPKGK